MTIERSIDIKASQAEVWGKLADLGGIQNFNPNVKKSYYKSTQTSGIGSARICEFHGAGIVDEIATDWQEGEGFTLKIVPLEKIPFFKEGHAKFTLSSSGDLTRVKVVFNYSVKKGPLAALMNRLAIKSQFAKGFEGILIGLKRHLEHGVLIDTIKDLKGYQVEFAV